MCDYFDGEYDEGEFIEDGMGDCDMEDTADSEFDDDLKQEDDQNDGLTWDEAYWIGTGLGFEYEEGRWERQKRNTDGSDDRS